MNHLSAGEAAARPRLVHTNLDGQASSLLFLCIAAHMHSWIEKRGSQQSLIWEQAFILLRLLSSNQRMHVITYTLLDVIYL